MALEKERKEVGNEPDLFREIFAHSSEAIAVLDLHGRYLEQNEAHRLLTGYSDAELLGKTPSWHLGEEVFSVILQEIGRAGLYKGACTIRTKDGSSVDAELAVFSVRNAAANRPGLRMSSKTSTAPGRRRQSSRDCARASGFRCSGEGRPTA